MKFQSENPFRKFQVIVVVVLTAEELAGTTVAI